MEIGESKSKMVSESLVGTASVFQNIGMGIVLADLVSWQTYHTANITLRNTLLNSMRIYFNITDSVYSVTNKKLWI